MSTGRIWSPRGFVKLGFAALIVLVGGFGSWGTFTQISGAIIASGQIESAQTRHLIQHPEGGIVRQLNVREGAQVEAGELLVNLETRDLDRELRTIEGQLFEVMARTGRLVAERDGASQLVFNPLLLRQAAREPQIEELMDGQTRLLRARADTQARAIQQLRQRKIQIRLQVEGLDAQHGAVERQLSLLSREIKQQSELVDKGLSQSNRLLGVQREEARLQGLLGEISAARAEQTERINEIELEILKRKDAQREDAISALRDLQYQEFNLTEQRDSLLHRIEQRQILAPVSGTVFRLQVVSTNAIIQPSHDIMIILERGQPAAITSRIDPSHIDEISVGQPVSVRLSTFDPETTPQVQGHVETISGDVFQDASTGLSYYRVAITLPKTQIDQLSDVDLLPGIPVDVFIQTAPRSPIMFLVQPMVDYFKRAFRET
ncbi:MAG: HlyD family type I secretion periplasmic adaptor subunit [Pseudomonadota bacterium]